MIRALNDETIGRPPTLANSLSLWALKLGIAIGAGILIIAVAASTIVAAAVAGIFYIIFLPVIVFGMER